MFGTPAQRFAARDRRVQDVLGEHQDAVVATHVARQNRARVHPTEAYAAGMLAERETQTRGTRPAPLPAVWEGARRPKLRRWL